MTDITSAANKIQTEETDFNSPVSESLAGRLGGSINYALDRNAQVLEFNGHGWHRLTQLSESPYHYIRRNSAINTYALTNKINGSSGAIRINARVFDENGVSLGNLFSVAPEIDSAVASSGATNRYTIGRYVEDSVDIEAGTNKVVGTLAFTQLDAGYKLEFFIEEVQVDGKDFMFKLWIREID